MTNQRFDVFLAHNSKDKPLIRQIYYRLKARGLNPWLDENEIPPGTKFQDEIQQAISQIKAAAICIGSSDLGRWQALELNAFIAQCVERDIPVIPVLLPGVILIPKSLLFLQQFHAVVFRDGIGDEQALFQLEWGVTQQKPPSVINRDSELIVQNSDLETGVSSSENNLLSDRGVDYSNLRDLLKVGNWKEADQETYSVMIKAVYRNYGDWFTSQDLLYFPCRDLQTIDGLWMKYSQGRFGFITQKKIYVQCGGKLDGKYPGKRVWRRFGERVGWRVDDNWLYYTNMSFKMSAPARHLPGWGWRVGCGGWIVGRWCGMFSGLLQSSSQLTVKTLKRHESCGLTSNHRF